MKIIGHRGAAGLAAENTLDAFKRGIEAGADIIECDVRLTKDNIPILFHDFHTLRSFGTPQLLSSLTYEQLKNIDTSKSITTLRELLDAHFGTTQLNIEFKRTSAAKESIEMISREYIRLSKDWDNILFSSFNPHVLQIIYRHAPNARLSLLHIIIPFKFYLYNHLNLAAVGFHHTFVSKMAIRMAKRRNLFTYLYTVDTQHEYQRAKKLGVDGIVTNRPDIFATKTKV